MTDRPQKLLFEALEKTYLPTKSGGQRKASIDEFILMKSNTIRNEWLFKHQKTKNYLLIYDLTGEINIPNYNMSFFMGYYDNE